jgi:hypothetical protein
MIHSCKDDHGKEFEMKDLGLLYYFLGLEIWQQDGELFVSQGKYTREILGKFHMEGCKPMDTCNTLFPLVYKNNYIGQELWKTPRCECVI